MGTGNNGQVLKSTGSGVEWANESGGGGGISFDGSTANGILTFKDYDEATVESRLTFSDPVVGSGNEYILEFGDVNNGSDDKAIIRPVRTTTGHIQTVVSCMFQLVKVLHLVVQLVIQGLPYIYLVEKREQVDIMVTYISEMEQLSLCILTQ